MKNILYITFVDFSDQKSGSSVRPKKIYDAFINKNYEVALLTGQQNNMKSRTKSIVFYFKKIRKGNYDFCYIEPPAGPIFNILDHFLIFYISKIKKVPVGLFYRDAFWKFADWYSVKGLKGKIIKIMHKFDWFSFSHLCNTLYFPSKSMADLFDFKKKLVLPPGCEIVKLSKIYPLKDEIIYVGGLGNHYGTDFMLKSLEIVNRSKDVVLNIVCRESEKSNLKEYLNKSWLKVHHLSGSELESIYSKCKLAIIPIKPNKYMDFAVPIKLLEYIGYGMPIVSTNCYETSKFITDFNIGVVSEFDEDLFAKSILELLNKDLDLYFNNINKARELNTWKARINTIDDSLM